VDFWATWCGPCRVLTPVLTKISQEKNISLIKIDIDDNQDLAIEYKVAAVPTVVLFKDGKEVTRFVGVKPEQEILKLISKYQ
jgi:thioredoxin 1